MKMIKNKIIESLIDEIIDSCYQYRAWDAIAAYIGILRGESVTTFDYNADYSKFDKMRDTYKSELQSLYNSDASALRISDEKTRIATIKTIKKRYKELKNRLYNDIVSFNPGLFE